MDSLDQKTQDGAGRLWTSLGQRPGLKMAWRRLPVFRSEMERRSAVEQEQSVGRVMTVREAIIIKFTKNEVT